LTKLTNFGDNFTRELRLKVKDKIKLLNRGLSKTKMDKSRPKHNFFKSADFKFFLLVKWGFKHFYYFIQEDVDTDGGGEVDKPPSWFQPQNHKTRLLQFHGAKYSAALTADLKVVKYDSITLPLSALYDQEWIRYPWYLYWNWLFSILNKVTCGFLVTEIWMKM